MPVRLKLNFLTIDTVPKCSIVFHSFGMERPEKWTVLVDQQLITPAMYIDDLHVGVVLQVLAYFTQKNIHATAVKVIIIMPYIEQGFLAGKHLIFTQAKQAEQFGFFG